MSMDRFRSAPNYRIISFQPLVEETLKIYLPGFKKEDLYVRLLQGVLQIGGKRTLDKEGLVKSFQFEFGFPKSGEICEVKASFINEVLQITFPKQLSITEAVAQTQQQEPLSSTLPLKESIALSRAKTMVINEDLANVERKDINRSLRLIAIEGDERVDDVAKYDLSMRSEVMKEKLKVYMENLMSLMGISTTELLEMGKSKVGRVTVTTILIVLGGYTVHLLTGFSKKYRHI
ncbi:hypothetical protein Sjap_008738 [Stephania japonica]|uniref:SHSP domain-containing protein n=1 Tax=Stephania japonica TaxID=461633 RepID=A0AAP0PCM7_9MAGN